MHAVIALGVLAVLVGFAFGAKAAKVVVGFSLCVMGGAMALLVFGVAIGVVQ